MNNKNYVKIYLKCIMGALYLIVSFGWILPFLISHKSDELPMLGVVYLITIPIVLFFLIKSVINNLKTKSDEKSI